MVTRHLRRLLPGSLSLSVEGVTSATESRGRTATPGTTAQSPTGALSVCLLSYRSNPYSGGQGVYVKYLSRALTALGHEVTVVSGKPYPDLDPEVTLVKLPGANVIEETDRLRAFEAEFLSDTSKLFEWVSVLTGGFPEPYTFGKRATRWLEGHGDRFDVIHDNQSLCYGLLDLVERGHPTVATIHHPITVDRGLALRNATGWGERLLTRRWYRFLRMQGRVAEELPHIITVSEASKRTAVDDFGLSPDDVSVVHNGIDTETFRPVPGIERSPNRIMTTVSADAPLKGAKYLLQAMAQLADHPSDPELVVIGSFDQGRECDRLIDDLGIRDRIETHSGVTTRRMVELYATAAVAVVPSLYEGFGLPAGEAMACGVPVVASRGGGLTEVVGDAGSTVPPGDATALADAIAALLEDPERRDRMGQRGRERMREQFDWEAAARETVTVYREAIADGDY